MPSSSRLWPRLFKNAAASLGLWAAAVGALAWYLPRWAAQESRAGRLPSDGDSIIIPLVGFAVLLAVVLVLVNVVTALVLTWRRFRRATASHAAG
jgi:cell division protein FtsX